MVIVFGLFIDLILRLKYLNLISRLRVRSIFRVFKMKMVCKSSGFLKFIFVLRVVIVLSFLMFGRWVILFVCLG